MASKPINIRWVRTRHEYLDENNNINTSFVGQGLQPLGSNKTCISLIVFLFGISTESINIPGVLVGVLNVELGVESAPPPPSVPNPPCNHKSHFCMS